MEDMFYIIRKSEKGDWWQLRLKDGHIVIACGIGKGYILQCLSNLVKRYKSTFNFRCAIQSMEKFPYSKEDMEVFKKQYKEQAHLYAKEVEETVNSAFKEVTSHKLKKKSSKVISPKIKPLVKKTKEEVAVTKEPEEKKRTLVSKKKTGLLKVNKKKLLKPIKK